jgi:hypothetical protein
MNTRIQRVAMTFGLLIVTAPLAGAQQTPSKSDMSNMPGMSATSPKSQTHDMAGMDMQSMMKQCGEMRRQMKPGAAMSADMRKMMSQCDEMDKSMIAPEQPYTPPAERRR